MEIKAGDQIAIPGKVLGQPERRGKILNVEGNGELRLRVSWENGQESIWMPHGAYRVFRSEEPAPS